MYNYAKRVTRPYRKALQSGYRDMRRALRQRLPGWAARPVDHIIDHLDLFIVDHGVFRVIYPNRHLVAPNVWRSSQPAPHDIALFATKGIRTIINLRGARNCGSYGLERTSCARHGITLIDFPAQSRGAPPASFFGEAKALFESIDYPVLMHCKSGADRVGLMSALYPILAEARPPEDAIRHLSLRYGHIRQAETGILDAVIEAYIRDNRHAPVGFLDWAATVYDPRALTARFKSRSWANMLVDSVLRRE
jgi:protein tyrosine/serine phosphatase